MFAPIGVMRALNRHDVREFKAQSVSYLVCTRLSIDTASDEYLAAFVRRRPAAPPLRLDHVPKH
jgi:hypothetical protein